MKRKEYIDIHVRIDNARKRRKSATVGPKQLIGNLTADS